MEIDAGIDAADPEYFFDLPNWDFTLCFASLLRNLPALQHLTFHLQRVYEDNRALPLPDMVVEAFKQHVSLTQVRLTGFGTDADLAIIRSFCERNRYSHLRAQFVRRFVAAELVGLPGLLEEVDGSEFSLSLIYDGLRIRRTDWAD